MVRREQSDCYGQPAGPDLGLMRSITARFGHHHHVTQAEAPEVVARVLGFLRLVDKLNPDPYLLVQLMSFALDDVRNGVGVNRSDGKIGDNNSINDSPPITLISRQDFKILNQRLSSGSDSMGK